MPRPHVAVEASVCRIRVDQSFTSTESAAGRRTRGAFSLYVPEWYDAARAWPLVVAMHGGSGNGGAFLWSWLRAARSHGAIVVAPTAIGQTWALTGPDLDTPNLAHIISEVGARWTLDSQRLLLTGMSDGATNSLVAGPPQSGSSQERRPFPIKSA